MKVYIDTLGCPKNEADSDVLENLFAENDYQIVEEATEAQIIIVNTCGFILDAKQESIDAIMDYSLGLKSQNKDLKVYVWGCLVQRYFEELTEEIPEVDGWIGLDSIENVFKVIDESIDKGEKLIHGLMIPNPIYGRTYRKVSGNKYYAYVKIGDGCDRSCAFCAIPGFKGKHISRKYEDILEEIDYLVNHGIKEIILVDQDTTQYSYGGKELKDLLVMINSIPGNFMIRVMYIHPDHIDRQTIDVMLKLDKVSNYFDIPVQHFSNSVLYGMNRIRKGEQVEEILKYIRKENPLAVLRTTVMVGFPGETEEDFDSLMDFIERVKFDRLGAFIFSPEEGTPSEKLSLPSVPEEISKDRYERVMELQEKICEENMCRFIGNEMRVLIEEIENGCFIARGYVDAPEIDGVIYVNQVDGISTGDFVNCKITESLEYDLEGEII